MSFKRRMPSQGGSIPEGSETCVGLFATEFKSRYGEMMKIVSFKMIDNFNSTMILTENMLYSIVSQIFR